MRRRYAVVLTREPDGSAWNVTVPALPGCFTWGATVDEALAMARDAIATHLDGERATEFPPPGEEVMVSLEIPVDERDGVLRTVRVAAAAGA